MRAAVAAVGLMMQARGACVVLAIVVGALGVTAVGASAGLVHPFVRSFGAFASPQAIAVSQSTGDVVVLDAGVGAVQKFDASGTPSDFSAVGSNTLDGTTTSEGAFFFDGPSAAQLAVDNSASSTDGYLYVTNSGAGVVDVFDATGTFVGSIDGTAASPQTGFEPCGVAVDAFGNLYVSYNEGHVDKYTPTDANPTHDTFDGQLESLPGGSCATAVDTSGNVYVGGRFGGPLTKYDPSQFGQDTASGTSVDAANNAVAVDPTTNDVYSDHGAQVFQYDPTGALTGKTGTSHLSGSSFGVAIDGGSGDVYASDAGTNDVLQFGPAVSVDAPVVTIDQPSNVTPTGATLTGTVNPSGTDPLNDTTWLFEYSTDGGFSFQSTAGGDIPPGTSPQQVSDQISGLIPNEEVQLRLVATNAADTVTSATLSFTSTAIPPTVTTKSAQDVSPMHASLPGLIDPNNSETTYYFEYGTTTAYGSGIPVTQDADAGSGDRLESVIKPIYGLQPGTTYHFRLVATNQADTARGQDQTFTTTSEPSPSIQRAGISGAGFLPDNRGWEKVSPNDKNGGDIMADSQLVRAATSGNAVDYASLSGFGDVRGTSIATEYLSMRDPQGWTTHAIIPQQQPLTAKASLTGAGSRYVGFSDDLSTGAFLGWSPVTADPAVAAVPNLYLRSDLKALGAGSYQLLTTCPLCQSANMTLPAPLGDSGGAGGPDFAGASADYGHVIFESQQPLTSEAPPGCNNNLADLAQCPPNLYEWDHGTLRAVGILPDSECGGPPPCPSPTGSQAGVGAGGSHYTPHTISADGSRIFFTIPNNPNLYMRVNHMTTIKLNISERATPDPRGRQAAIYADASVDGSRILFTSREALTDDAPPDNVAKLYLYDASKPDSDPHNLTLLASDQDSSDGINPVSGVLGASADARYVYFSARGRLLPDQAPSPGAQMIYVWHDGSVRFVAGIGSGDLPENVVGGNWAFNVKASRVTPDGVHLLFSSRFSSVAPTGYDQTCVNGGNCRQLYLYTYASQRLACISCNPTGARATGSAFTNEKLNDSAAGTVGSQNQPLSDDGRKVFFTSPDALVPEDVNGKDDVYEYDVATGTLRLLTSGRDPSDSFFVNASSSGSDVFFLTRAQLVGSDDDRAYDLYDARIDGGFTEPPPAVQPCSGEACLPPQAVAPGAATSNTGPAAGEGDVPTAKPKPRPKRCRKGTLRRKVHRKVRCVKVSSHRHKAKRATRAARANRAERRAK